MIDYEDDMYDILKLTAKRLEAENVEKEKMDAVKREKQKIRDEEKKAKRLEKRKRAQERGEKERSAAREEEADWELEEDDKSTGESSYVICRGGGASDLNSVACSCCDVRDSHYFCLSLSLSSVVFEYTGLYCAGYHRRGDGSRVGSGHTNPNPPLTLILPLIITLTLFPPISQKRPAPRRTGRL